MKKIIALLIVITTCQQIMAQGILDRIKDKAKQKANQKIDQKIDEAIEKGIDNASKKKDKKASDETNNTEDTKKETKQNGTTNNSSMAVYSKFDFVPGEKIIAFEDFSQDNVGDFPDKWNTNGSGEIVTSNTFEGKFLQTSKECTFYPEWIKSLPDNFTVEFDLYCTDKFSYYSGSFVIGFTNEINISKDWKDYNRFGVGSYTSSEVVIVNTHPTSAGSISGRTELFTYTNAQKNIGNEVVQSQFSSPKNKNKVHVSIWRQKQRLRVYYNETKVWDIPKAFSATVKLNSIFFKNDGAWNANENDAYYFGNLKVAIGTPDTRNKLITEGKFVSHGILFDSNSDKIKPESYGAIKEIATVLTENATVNVKIIGHTDSDGDDKANLDLSKKRAEAVKNFLQKEFKIDAARLQTDGKGESQPLEANTTIVGKANNRRVEFVKL